MARYGSLTYVRWQSHCPVHRVDVIYNGQAAETMSYPEGSTGGELEAQATVDYDGWAAASLSSNARDSYAQPVSAHTQRRCRRTPQAGGRRPI